MTETTTITKSGSKHGTIQVPKGLVYSIAALGAVGAYMFVDAIIKFYVF